MDNLGNLRTRAEGNSTRTLYFFLLGRMGSPLAGGGKKRDGCDYREEGNVEITGAGAKNCLQAVGVWPRVTLH